MKELMLGNAAVARGMYEAGCKVVSSYPGTPSTEITEEAVKFPEIYCEWAPNEKVAVESAFGASLAGVRSSCAMKHVGLNVAADPVFSISYIGVRGGMVICVADDPGMHSSQNEQDSRHYARASKIPMLEPADSAEALAFTKLAFDLSEEYNTPVFLKMCTRIAHSQSVVETSERVERDTIPYVKDVHNVMTPANAKVRHPIVEQRTQKLIEYAETAPINRMEMGGTKMGIITSSTSYQYVKEVFGDSVSVLKLGMIWPLPEKLIRDFAAKVEKLVVVEELDPFIEEHCRQLGLEVSGKDLVYGGPRVVTVTEGDICEALHDPVQAVVETVLRALEQAPPALAADVYDNGLLMAGGGALLRGLDQCIARATHLKVVVDKDPLTTVLRGTAQAMLYREDYEGIFIN